MAKKDDDNNAGDIKLPVHSVGKIIFWSILGLLTWLFFTVSQNNTNIAVLEQKILNCQQKTN